MLCRYGASAFSQSAGGSAGTAAARQVSRTSMRRSFAVEHLIGAGAALTIIELRRRSNQTGPGTCFLVSRPLAAAGAKRQTDRRSLTVAPKNRNVCAMEQINPLLRPYIQWL